jgi:hypothetical protein
MGAMNNESCRSGFGSFLRSSVATVALMIAGCVGLQTAARGQSFINMNFEGAGQQPIVSNAVWLNWNVGAPGWGHAGGGDSVFVYHNTPSSTVGQSYFLADCDSTQYAPLDGSYSLVLLSGHSAPYDSTSPWIHAWIAQSGAIPAGTSSFEMLATGNFSVSINSTAIQMINMGGNLYGGNVAQFAGQTATLLIMNQSSQLNSPVILDDLSFSAQPAPEPGSASLLALGSLATVIGYARRSRRSSSARRG